MNSDPDLFDKAAEEERRALIAPKGMKKQREDDLRQHTLAMLEYETRFVGRAA